MLTNGEIKKAAMQIGAEKCGIASQDRFSGAPEGFHPVDIFDKCKSVVVYLTSMPASVILSANPVPYTGVASVLYSEIDRIGLSLARFLEANRIGAVPVPCDNPYLYWDASRMHGQGILSLRHAGYLAGLGVLGRNTLLINRDLGNMVYIGAVLIDEAVEPDLMVDDFHCPPKCNLCVDACPTNALDGKSVIQGLCRQISIKQIGRGFDAYVCNQCRLVCPARLGYKRLQEY